MKPHSTLLCTLFALCALTAPPQAQAQTPAPPVTLLHNVRIFDGSGSALSAPSQVLVRGNRIERIVPAAACQRKVEMSPRPAK